MSGGLHQGNVWNWLMLHYEISGSNTYKNLIHISILRTFWALCEWSEKMHLVMFAGVDIIDPAVVFKQRIKIFQWCVICKFVKTKISVSYMAGHNSNKIPTGKCITLSNIIRLAKCSCVRMGRDTITYPLLNSVAPLKFGNGWVISSHVITAIRCNPC